MTPIGPPPAGCEAPQVAPGPEPSTTPLLVAVHGWLLSGRLWEPLRRELEPRLPCWCPDLPGFGDRSRPRDLQPSLASYGRWLAEAVRAEAGDRPVVLIGHSLGGSVALHAAPLLGRQLRGLVQVAAGGGVYQPRAFGRLRQGGAAVLALRPAWLAGLPLLAPWRGPLLAEGRAARGLLACSTNRGAVAQLPRLTAVLEVPSHWIAGSRDNVMEPRYVRHLAGYSPLHRLELLEGAGHLPMQQMPRHLADVIEAWLLEEGVVAGAPPVASTLLPAGQALAEVA
jgi:pimeloyl-ACP methyl ester carboxylesterase